MPQKEDVIHPPNWLNAFGALEVGRLMLTCPQCGSEMDYVRVFSQYYCRRCFRYLNDMKGGLASTMNLRCEKCGDELVYVKQYARHYCYGCKAFAPKGISRSGELPQSRNRLTKHK